MLARANEEYRRGDYGAALRLYRDALSALAYQDGPSVERARVLTGLGNCYELISRKGRAVTMWHRALAELRDVGQGSSAEALQLEGSIESYERHPLAFISYAHLDVARIEGVEQRLVAAGCRMVRDIRDFRAGASIMVEIDEVMERCPNYLVFWSKAYAQREFTKIELEKVRELMDSASPRHEPGRRAIVAAIDEEPLPSILGKILMIPHRGADAAGLAEEIVHALSGVRPEQRPLTSSSLPEVCKSKEPSPRMRGGSDAVGSSTR